MAKRLSPKDYFEIVLPTMLRWKGPAAAALGVTLRFVVSGRDGGTWTLLLRPPLAKVIAGSELKADLIIKITTEEMTSILEGTFDARKAIADGSIELSGDLSVLKRVSFIFQTGGSQAEVRAALAAGTLKEEHS